MRALTVRQPWAWAIFHGKNVDNRSGPRKWTITGPLIIHAGQQLADGSAWDDVARLAEDEMPVLGAPGEPAECGVGAAIGVVDVPAVAHWWRDCLLASGRMCSPWAHRDAWHIPLRDPRPFNAAVECSGQLGLWRPPREVLVATLEVL